MDGNKVGCKLCKRKLNEFKIGLPMNGHVYCYPCFTIAQKGGWRYVWFRMKTMFKQALR